MFVSFAESDVLSEEGSSGSVVNTFIESYYIPHAAFLKTSEVRLANLPEW